ncbi:hypothetical protein, partial [Pseudaminobacter sp. NGMCC 1.201702]|uniref:hypothetical protein n=1 Tax=Pseudaminobacter sp. NGMCC 1.201702 TaxID=3391825 RepID=UPI0039EEB9DA
HIVKPATLRSPIPTTTFLKCHAFFLRDTVSRRTQWIVGFDYKAKLIPDATQISNHSPRDA